MEGELAPHVSMPQMILGPSAVTKKRGFHWSVSDIPQQQYQPSTLIGVRGSSVNWNMKAWDWDSAMFVAKPINTEDQRSNPKIPPVKEKEPEKPWWSNRSTEDADEDNLTLKLGDGSYGVSETAAAGRPNKRACSGLPNNNYPMCQVDDCKEYLSSAKDYHRRHKVCEVHSKTTQALVGKQMQRFCQQCSRFHPLQEFDEGKRSCRRRLAGHNKRRRKIQPVDGSLHVLLPGAKEDTNSGKVDLVSLITALACLKGNNIEKTGNDQSLPDKENHLLQVLSKINSLKADETRGRFHSPENLDLNVKQLPLSLEHASITSGDQASQHDFPLATSTAKAACTRTQTRGTGTSNQDIDEMGNEGYRANKLNREDHIVGSSSNSYSCTPQSSPGFLQRTLNLSPDVLEPPAQPVPSMPLRLFVSSSEDDSMTEMHRGRNYFSSDSSNPSQEMSPLCSPVMQRLFPLHCEEEIREEGRLSEFVKNCSPIEGDNNKWKFTLRLLTGGIDVSSNLAHRGKGSGLSARTAGYSSSSFGSDNSPSSSNPDKRDQTGRIIFKLFGKDPSDLPDSLRLQIFDWLKHSPSEMESYIRPGCVFLAVYLSMPSLSWQQLHANFRQQVTSLVRDTSSDFWRKGSFLVHMDRQFASHKDGKIRSCKSWKGFDAPELIYASPLAVVSAKHISVTLRGQNLVAVGNRIHCTYMGAYVSAEVSEDSSVKPNDEFISVKFNFPNEGSMLFGRCFIEVENGLKGNSFPLIIADLDTCLELRSLEDELERDSKPRSGHQAQDGVWSSSREHIVHFLNELGWLFQKSTGDSMDTILRCNRFRHLLVFSVERDWTVVVKRILDILLHRRGVQKETMEELTKMLSEIHLLHQAVRRRCLKMINLLLHYQFHHRDFDSSRGYIFVPNLVGPGGITPLHLAADSQGSEELVDALTNDPQDIGLSAWTSARDAEGLSPYGYALIKNHRSYNSLVQRKQLDKAKGQVSIRVASSDSLEMNGSRTSSSGQRSCAQCAISAMRTRDRPFAGKGTPRAYIIPILAVAAVCVCVSIICRGHPELGKIAPFMWENISSGWE